MISSSLNPTPPARRSAPPSTPQGVAEQPSADETAVSKPAQPPAAQAPAVPAPEGDPKPAADGAPAKDRPASRDEAGGFSKKVVGYTGPADGLSHPHHKKIIVPIVQALVAGRYRVEVEGRENLEMGGGQMICPTHPSAFDPGLVVALMGQRDVRYMSNMQMFRSIMGPLFTAIGAFPVNREGAALTTMRHCNEILKEGKDLCVFPEGTLTGLDDQVGPIKKGAAAAALAGGAERIVPMAMNYEKDTKTRVGEALLGGLAACAVTAGGVFAAVHGGPTAQLAASVLGAATAGSFLMRNIVRKFIPAGGPELQQAPKYVAGVGAAVVGATMAGTAAGLTATFCPSLAATLPIWAGAAAGLATMGWARIFRHRDIARVVVCEPIDLAPYKKQYADDKRETVTRLTEDLHRALGKAKEKLTGVPYDDTAPKIGGKVIDGFKGKPLIGSGKGHGFTSMASGHKKEDAAPAAPAEAS